MCEAASVSNKLISDNAPKYEHSDPEESEKQRGPRDPRNFGIITSYDCHEKASEYGKSPECSGDQIQKLC